MLRPAIICLALGANPALADTVTLDVQPVSTTAIDYQALMRVERLESLSPLNEAGHVVGVADFQGVATFDGYETVPHRYAGTFEAIDGNGAFHGRAEFQFPDGAVRFSYEGVFEPADENAVFTATMHSAEGTGRYAGVTGGGSFEGHRLGDFHEGTHAVVQGTLRLKQEAE